MGAGGTEWVCDAGRLKADHCPLVVAGVCNFPVDFLLCRVNDKWAGLTQPGALKHVRGELIWKIFLSPLPVHMVGETPMQSKSQRSGSPSVACQLLLLTARLKADFSYLHTAGSRGRPLWNACASSLVSHAERRAALFLFTASKADEK